MYGDTAFKKKSQCRRKGTLSFTVLPSSSCTTKDEIWRQNERPANSSTKFVNLTTEYYGGQQLPRKNKNHSRKDNASLTNIKFLNTNTKFLAQI